MSTLVVQDDDFFKNSGAAAPLFFGNDCSEGAWL
jgi:hypothetical protein